MEELNKRPTSSIIREMTYLDQEIGLLVLKYNRLVEEITKRFPQVKDEDAFQTKMLYK